MSLVGYLGSQTISRVAGFGDFCRFTRQSMSWVLSVLSHGRSLRLLLPQFYEIATRSVPVLMITGMFVGMVLAVQAVMQFKAIGMEAKLGTIVNLSALRELGPVLAGMMLAGRVGGGITAELGTMRVTEQIEALRAMGADPLRVLVIPRFLALTLMSPALVLYTSVTSILGGFMISVYVYGVNAADFWESSAQSIGYFDIFQGPIKSMFFGAAISMVACFKGFRCAAGAAGVGRACTEGFVLSCMTILGLDLFLGMFLNTMEVFVYGLRSIF